jgi:hypothetical protein
MIGRRSFLIGIAAGIAAPAIVRPASIMRVNALLVPNILTFSFPHPKPGQILTIHNVTNGATTLNPRSFLSVSSGESFALLDFMSSAV